MNKDAINTLLDTAIIAINCSRIVMYDKYNY